MRKYTALFGYTQDELKAFYLAGKTIIGAYNGFYEIQYSQAQQQFYCVKSNYHYIGFARKGRHYILTPADVNKVLKKDVFWEA